ncbi:MAG: nicotinate phosphoribosyltransferase [Chloroflexi bacterium]|jgi:nicotinate phosphoribosyltransferase|nr:nicotinate phosphoribosyltransferase [Chloroflexota bacterium]
MWSSSAQTTGLMTDLYHPDAAYISWRTGHNEIVTFDLYARAAPFDNAYLLVAGLELALAFVRSFQYTDGDVAYLRQIRDYDDNFLRELLELRFTGEILAMSEGTISFPNEPLVRVTAPFREALLLESGLLHFISVSTLIATKAARIVHAARGRPVSEFAFRRVQEPFIAARAASIGGCATTSFVAAAKAYRLRATGTIPHAVVQLFESEHEAFEAVAASFNRYTFLLDTYNVEEAIHTAVAVARDAQQRLGHTLAAVRLDSGDLLALSKYCRDVLNASGLGDVRVLASGDLDEYRIAELVEQGAPIDSFGVGTAFAGGALGGVYKVVWLEEELAGGEGKIKLAGEKTTWPGRKEVYRIGAFTEDVIQLESEPPPADGTRLLRPVMRGGMPLPGSEPPISEIWELAQQNISRLPEKYKAIRNPDTYPVHFSPGLQELRQRTSAHYLDDGVVVRLE